MVFLTAAAHRPLTGATQPAKMPVIGMLSTLSDRAAWLIGFAEGRDVAIDYLWAEGHNDRLPALAADFVRREVAIIIAAASTPGARAAKAATQTIPIVFFIGTDPVKVGLVASLARPGATYGRDGPRRRADHKISSADAQPDASRHEDWCAGQPCECAPDHG